MTEALFYLFAYAPYVLSIGGTLFGIGVLAIRTYTACNDSTITKGRALLFGGMLAATAPLAFAGSSLRVRGGDPWFPTPAALESELEAKEKQLEHASRIAELREESRSTAFKVAALRRQQMAKRATTASESKQGSDGEEQIAQLLQREKSLSAQRQELDLQSLRHKPIVRPNQIRTLHLSIALAWLAVTQLILWLIAKPHVPPT